MRRADLRSEELIGIGFAVAVLLILLVLILVVVGMYHHKRRRKTVMTSSQPPDVDEIGFDNWSIPRPRPRVWQTSASMISSERRRSRPRYRDDDDDDEDVLELRQRSNGHAVQPLHRTANGGLSAHAMNLSFELIPSAGQGVESPSSGSMRTPRLQRYVAHHFSRSMLISCYILVIKQMSPIHCLCCLFEAALKQIFDYLAFASTVLCFGLTSVFTSTWPHLNSYVGLKAWWDWPIIWPSVLDTVGRVI